MDLVRNEKGLTSDDMADWANGHDRIESRIGH